jgi:hypothetical protein
MPAGRPRGVSNKEGHSAGGSRLGAGRKRSTNKLVPAQTGTMGEENSRITVSG